MWTRCDMVNTASQKCHELEAMLPIPRSDAEQADLTKIVDYFGLNRLGFNFFSFVISYKALANFLKISATWNVTT